MRILRLNKNNEQEVREEVLKIFRSGGLVIYPTETCYGAGVLATNSDAVKKLLKYKKRPSGKAISVAVANQKIAQKYVDLNVSAVNIYKKFLPGPVTVISKYKGGLASGLSSEFNTLGIRIPNYAFILDLLEKLGEPVTATSANSSGKKTPYCIQDVFDNISESQKKLIDLVIDVGNLPKNPPSTVVDTTTDSMQVLRQGRISPDDDYVQIDSEEEMQRQGETFTNKHLKDIQQFGLVVLLNAELGAGKTQFVKGIGKALQIKEIIKSPTYSILEEYDSKDGFLVHIDTWRLTNLEEFEQLEIEKYFKKGNIIAVEWSAGVEDFLLKVNKTYKLKIIKIDIDYIDLDKRRLKIWD